MATLQNFYSGQQEQISTGMDYIYESIGIQKQDAFSVDHLLRVIRLKWKQCVLVIYRSLAGQKFTCFAIVFFFFL